VLHRPIETARHGGQNLKIRKYLGLLKKQTFSNQGKSSQFGQKQEMDNTSYQLYFVSDWREICQLYMFACIL